MGEGLAVRRGPSEWNEGQLQKAGLTGAATAQILSLQAGKARAALLALAERDQNGEVLTAVRHFPAREAAWAEFPEWVNGICGQRTERRGSRGCTATRRRRRRR